MTDTKSNRAQDQSPAKLLAVVALAAIAEVAGLYAYAFLLS